MNADIQGLLNNLNTWYKCIEHKGNKMSKEQAKAVLEYGISKKYETTDQISDYEVDCILSKMDILNTVKSEIRAVSNIIGGEYSPAEHIRFDFEESDEIMQIILRILTHFPKVTISQIMSKSRKRELVLPRHLCCYFLFELVPTMGLTGVGRYLGGRDHSTIDHAINAVNDLCDTDKFYRARFEKIKESLEEL